MNYRFLTMIVVALLGACQAGVSLAQAVTADASDQKPVVQSDQGAPEIAAIRAQSEAFVAAFNRGDAKAVAALWTEDGEYIDDSGHHFAGRGAIEKGYTEFFAGNSGAKIQISIDSIRLLSNGTAIEDGRAAPEPPADNVGEFTKYTVIHVKVGGKWKMASVRDALVRTHAAVSSAADLEWLVGTWIAEEHGLRMESVVSWIADGRFLERKYTTTQLDGTTSSSVQLVGWNPLEGHVQSWSFSPDGGHAVGIWIPKQDGWVAQMRGITGDGIPTVSTNHLRRLDDKAYVWQSVQRSAGTMTLRDTDEVVWKRQPANR